MLAAFWSRPNKAQSNTATNDDPLQEELKKLKRFSSSEALSDFKVEDVKETERILNILEGRPTADKLAAVQEGLAIADGLIGFRKFSHVEELLRDLEGFVMKIAQGKEQELALAKVYRSHAKYFMFKQELKSAIRWFAQAVECIDGLDVKEFKISCLIDTARCYKLLNERDLNHSYCKQASDTVKQLKSYMKIYDYHRQIVANLDDSNTELAGNQIVDYLHAIIESYRGLNVPNAYRANVYAYFARELDGNAQPERGNFYARKALELVNYNTELKDSLEDELAWLAFPKERFIAMLVELKAKRQWNEEMLQEEENWFNDI